MFLNVRLQIKISVCFVSTYEALKEFWFPTIGTDMHLERSFVLVQFEASWTWPLFS